MADGGVVMMTVSQAVAMSPSFPGFTAGNGVAISDSAGLVHFTASAPAGTFTLDIQGPLVAGDRLPLVAPSAAARFTVADPGAEAGSWANGGGELDVDGLDPYRLRFVAIPMRVASGSVTGTFFFDGSGSFK